MYSTKTADTHSTMNQPEIGDRTSSTHQPESTKCGVNSNRNTHSSGDLDKEAVCKVYAHWAPFYDATFGTLVKRYRRHVRTTAKTYNAREILEIGVGTGGSLRHYPKDSHVTGIDMCEEMLIKAQKLIDEGVDANVELRLADGESLAFPDKSFDLVVMLFVISVTPDHRKLLDEVARVLRPGGHALIINHFEGVRGFGWIERLVAPMADRVGFRSQLPIHEVHKHPMLTPVKTTRLWPLGFFSLVILEQREKTSIQ